MVFNSEVSGIIENYSFLMNSFAKMSMLNIIMFKEHIFVYMMKSESSAKQFNSYGTSTHRHFEL